MKQVFYPYTDWEDFKNGMYCLQKKENESELVYQAVTMLRDNDLFFNTCKDILKDWPVSSKVNLSDRSSNRKAWLGQAACNHKFKVPEALTRVAWSKLTYCERVLADNVALKIINHFELKYAGQSKGLYFNLGETVL